MSNNNSNRLFPATRMRRMRQDDFSRTSYVGSYYSSFAWIEGGVAVGGDEQSRSAILIELIGEDLGDVFFDVLINSTHRGTARVCTTSGRAGFQRNVPAMFTRLP